jgi:hypothetical protein
VRRQQTSTSQGGNIVLWHQVTEKLNSFVGLFNNWNGEGGRKPKVSIIESARVFLKDLQIYRSSPDDIYLLSDGEICLEWKKDKKIIDRIFVTGVGTGYRKITYPHKEAEYYDLTW